MKTGDSRNMVNVPLSSPHRTYGTYRTYGIGRRFERLRLRSEHAPGRADRQRVRGSQPLLRDQAVGAIHELPWSNAGSNRGQPKHGE